VNSIVQLDLAIDDDIPSSDHVNPLSKQTTTLNVANIVLLVHGSPFRAITHP